MNGETGFVPHNYIEMKPNPWFVGKITRCQAEERLLKKSNGVVMQPDGAFLVRMSESAPGEFSISVKFKDSIQHFKVLRDGQGKYYLWCVKFNSVNEIIDYHRTNSVSRTQTIMLKDLITEKNAIAMYDFKPEDPSELGFRKGDVITVLEYVDENWWNGRLNDREGLFPAAYVKLQ